MILPDRTQRLGARGPQRALAHGIEADVPAVWAGSEQPNRHAVGMPSLLNGVFIGQIRELLLGSGPRGRRFKSSRPDQLFPQKRPDSFGDSAFRVSGDVARNGSRWAAVGD